MRQIFAILLVSTFVYLDPRPAAAGNVGVGELRCEYGENPLGIDVLAPRLSWVLKSAVRGQSQTAYQVLVAGCSDKLVPGKADLWDSGKIDSDQSCHVVYAGKELTSGQPCYWKVRVWNKDGQPSDWSQPDSWSMGLLKPSDWQAQWIGAPPCNAKRTMLAGPAKDTQDDSPIPPSPLLRKSFDVTGGIRRAMIYVTALGVYELQINGRRVGDHILAPEWTNYQTRIQYQTFDVTEMLREGPNAVGATLADGWYAGRLGPIEWPKPFPRRGVYGFDRQLLVQLEIEKADGSRQIVATDGTWKIDPDSPIRSADNFLGEVYDASKDQPGWDTPGFDDSAWKPVTVYPSSQAVLSAQMNEPIRIVDTIATISIAEPKPGVYVFDLGQNIVGWASVRLEGPAGTEVTLRHGECIEDDGMLYTANLKSAIQTEKYVLDGRGPREFHPHFTYHGFRYVQVTGLAQRPTLDMLTGKVIASHAPVVGQFVCSNPLLSQIWKNIVWTQRGNMHSVPTDCPQRSERMGWMGSDMPFLQTAIFNMDMAAFYTKYIRDMRDAQFADGRFPDYTPFPHDDPSGKPADDSMFSQTPFHNMGAPGTMEAAIVIPWNVYLNYGDKRILEQHYPAAKRCIEYLRSVNPDLIRKHGSGHGFDWLNGDMLDVEGFPKHGAWASSELFGTAFFAHATALLAKMAAMVGRDDEARQYGELAEQIKAAFQRVFVEPDGRTAGDTQTGYALALAFDLLPDELRPKAAEHFMANICGPYHGHLSTGVSTTHHAMLELSRNGYHDAAYRIANLRTCPSWGYMIDNGATTIWEWWDGYVKERSAAKFKDPNMNSFNHREFGSVGEWMWRTLVGLNPDEANPGYKHFFLRPRPVGDLTWLKAEYDSIHGPIVVDWRLEEGRFTLRTIIPPNTSATIAIPTNNPETVREGDVPAVQAAGVRFLRREEGQAVYSIVSGEYRFVSDLK